jgi:hypothetical protein
LGAANGPTVLESVSELTQSARERRAIELVTDFSPLLGGLEHSGLAQHREVS